MLELGRAQKTIFITRYLPDHDLQREINEGLNLIEAWNRVNTVIFYGKSGEFASNRRDQQQLGMLALHILQAADVTLSLNFRSLVIPNPPFLIVMSASDKEVGLGTAAARAGERIALPGARTAVAIWRRCGGLPRRSRWSGPCDRARSCGPFWRFPRPPRRRPWRPLRR